MKMKNKLYRHHKSKFSLFMRNFAFVSLGVFVFSLAVTIPTYLSIKIDGNVPTLASEEKEPEEVEEKTPQDEEETKLEKID